jgi:FkbM family methyltransferase
MSKLYDNPHLRRLLGRVYPYLPKPIVDNLSQWLRRRAPEADFELLGRMADVRALVVDVGANRGHSAIAVLRKTRRMKVVSLEPNPALRWALLLIKMLHPVRFSFKLVGAGKDSAEQVLHIPLSSGHDLSTQASLSLEEFDKVHVRERLQASGHDRKSAHPFKESTIQVISLDSLDLAPDLIKIDTEGWESQVLEGALQTLRDHLPAILIEVNATEAWMPLLSGLGYRFYSYDAATGIMSICDTPQDTLNLWCLHDDQRSPFANSLHTLLQLPEVSERV